MIKSTTRKIFFDTETTGLSPENGDRVIQIGLVEMIDEQITKVKEYFINPEGKKSARRAFEVHGIKDQFLLDKPSFAEIADEFLTFIKGAELYAHNANFDIAMLNNELSLHGKTERINQICTVFDTLDIAKKKLPLSRFGLDVIMKHLKIDYAKKRDYHSALEDSIILAKVYLAMHKREVNLFSFSNHDLTDKKNKEKTIKVKQTRQIDLANIKVILSKINEDEQESHEQFFKTAQANTMRR